MGNFLQHPPFYSVFIISERYTSYIILTHYKTTIYLTDVEFYAVHSLNFFFFSNTFSPLCGRIPNPTAFQR